MTSIFAGIIIQGNKKESNVKAASFYVYPLSYVAMTS